MAFNRLDGVAGRGTWQRLLRRLLPALKRYPIPFYIPGSATYDLYWHSLLYGSTGTTIDLINVEASRKHKSQSFVRTAKT